MSRTDADRRDTPRAAPWSPRPIRPQRTVWLAVLCAVLLLVPARLAQATGAATPAGAPLDARVVWVDGDRVYLASPDSLAVQRAMRLTFLSRGKPIAQGEVSEVLDRSLARARITSGAISDTRHLDRLSIFAEPPRAPRLLRIGYPASERRADPAPCPGRLLAVDTTTHRVETAGRMLRITRLPEAAATGSWPDTLIVQRFDDAADEEIALERGELEVGVFWPGELSAHMREHPRWRDPLTVSSGAPPGDCPVLCDPGLRPLVNAIGARAFVELYRCPEDPR